MKPSTRWLFMSVVIVGVLLCGSIMFLLAPEVVRYSEHQQYPLPAEYCQTVRSYVGIGHERDETVRVIIANTAPWYHGTCDYSNSDNQIVFTKDVFFYGPQNQDYVRVVVVRSNLVEGKMSVFQISTLENYALEEVKDCLPPEFINLPKANGSSK